MLDYLTPCDLRVEWVPTEIQRINGCEAITVALNRPIVLPNHPKAPSAKVFKLNRSHARQMDKMA
jgi:hypothetical protein